MAQTTSGAGPATEAALPRGFRGAELGWPELHRIPHPPHRLPLLGDVIGADRRTPVQDSMRHARQLGPVFRRKAFGKEFVFVWGAGPAADLADESRFAKHVGLGVANLRPVVGDALFTAYNHEPNWQLAHDVLAPGFSREAMEGYHPMMLAVAERLTDHWDRELTAGRAVDVPGDMTKLTLETIARTGFGHDFGSFERSRPHPFVSAMVGTLSYAQRLNTVPAPLAPYLLRRASRRNEADMTYLNRTVDDLVLARRASDGGGDGDLLDRMLETAHPRTGERLSAENVRRQVITFLVAGHETTSGALSFALHYLSRHPEIAARARAEVDAVWGDTAVPGYDQVAKLRYVRRVLDEALRLWPTAPAFAREARADTVLAGDHPMKRGAWALVLTMMLHRDPEVWGIDPERFDPDRFDPKAVRARAPHTFKPFGTGARACIGRQFALHEATLVLGLLLRRYDLRPDPDYRLRVTERLTLMPEGLRLHLERRPVPAGADAAATSATASAAAVDEAPSGPRCPVHGAGD
ncbi:MULTISPECIES: cytochrome P450 [unclassified Streptomyces]|uniref:cytochrome P450 n=1 Tax=unclassified Streptomyces TaxID=2593676 RepID=UPI002251EEE1|nr:MULTISPECIES: cytochrome P450 [unclassified Streptomyces]MCX5052251.1 cytochrome P450 [Streptomyces sp. NBC_00474]MCX5063999.1 cytochrome P450 [Streptomyces sp. NBC_00452]MCX5251420.1 cytochrome P450 [Streptomyces sp. NBC_00201]MCX5294656.1 cytochrome P450 [Streptomyces sp. NBC_00183]